MFVYHEIKPDALESVKTGGLKRTSRGEKGSEDNIIKTDRFLDDHRPGALRDAGVSRDDNLYAFVTDGEVIVNIVDGKHIKIEDFLGNSNHAVLKLDVDPSRCFVSDLDAYDKVGDLLHHNTKGSEMRRHADEYWQKLIPLENFSIGDIKRPEIMITYDVKPNNIEIIKT